MKTMTEFAGVHLRQALALYLDAMRGGKGSGGAKVVVKPVGGATAEASPSDAPAAEPVVSESQASPVSETEPAVPADAASEALTHEPSLEAVPTESVAAEAEAPVAEEVSSAPESAPGEAASVAPVDSSTPSMEAVSGDPAIKKRVAPIQISEEVVAAVKAKITETLKIEGDRLNLIWEAVQTLDRRKPKELIRRVIVMTVAEGEKAPQGAVKRGDNYFLAEYLPESILGRRGGRPRGQHEGRGRPGRGGRDGKRGGGGRGRGGPGAGRGEGRGDGRRPGGPGRGGPNGEMHAGPNGDRGGAGGGRGPGGPGRDGGRGRGRPGGGRGPGGPGRGGPRGPHSGGPQQQAGGRPTPTPGGPKIVIKPVSKPGGAGTPGTPAGGTPPSETPTS